MKDHHDTDHRVAMVTETCECEYPCGHGRYVHTYELSEPRPGIAARAARRGDDIPSFAYEYSEVAEFPDWLHMRIVKAEEMVACLSRLAAGEGDSAEAQRILEDLERDPIDLENERIAALKEVDDGGRHAADSTDGPNKITPPADKRVSSGFIEAMRRHGVDKQTIRAAEKRNKRLRNR